MAIEERWQVGGKFYLESKKNNQIDKWRKTIPLLDWCINQHIPPPIKLHCYSIVVFKQYQNIIMIFFVFF